jgi:hypothetical protein
VGSAQVQLTGKEQKKKAIFLHLSKTGILVINKTNRDSAGCFCSFYSDDFFLKMYLLEYHHILINNTHSSDFDRHLFVKVRMICEPIAHIGYRNGEFYLVEC